LPWFRGISTNAINKHWTAWTILPWIVLIVGCWVFARRAFETALNEKDAAPNCELLLDDKLECRASFESARAYDLF
jgi:hypothetical protein